MSHTPKILAFGGSLRRDSLNQKLAVAAAESARAAGAEVTLIALRDFPMPIYDGDIESASGLPEHAKRFKALLKEHDALLIASPEYNSSISAALKNAIDWASRAEPGEAPLACFAGKVAGLMGASPGPNGGLRGLVTVRSILSNIQVIVLPEQVTLSKANEAFGADGKLIEARQQANVDKLTARLVRVAGALRASSAAAR